uniref:Uncharacterized protein n=1 Tax=Thermogemmatispora argillosa TaxID=2045280 RepID=A0A455T092_9CHLR|nr:hypothetical protein KTA_14570 [Thermogemmatispora argillosa]
MVNDSNIFFSPGQENAEEWVHRYLRTVKDCLEEMRALFLYKVNLREIGVALLEDFDRELRSISEHFDTDPVLKASLRNTDALVKAIFDATIHINLAISLRMEIQSKNIYSKLRLLLYEYKSIADAITNILDILQDASSSNV